MTLLELGDKVPCAQLEEARLYDEGKLHNLIARYRDCAVIEVIKGLGMLKRDKSVPFLFPRVRGQTASRLFAGKGLGKGFLNVGDTLRKGTISKGT